MRTVSNEYLEAVKGIGREWKNTVTLSDGVHTETYDSASIKITESFATDSESLTVGGAFSNSCEITLYQPLQTVAYKRCEIRVQSGLLVGDDYEYVDMGIFYPSEVSTEDDYQTLHITAYDRMATLQEQYVPSMEMPTTDADIINDICNKYGIEYMSTINEAQLIRDNDTYQNEIYTIEWNDGSVTCTSSEGLGRHSYREEFPALYPIDIIKGHKYAIVEKGKPFGSRNYNEWYVAFRFLNDETYYKQGEIVQAKASFKLDKITFAFDYKGGVPIAIPFNGWHETRKPMLVDLTMLYGKGYEPTYAEFVADYPDYYEHNNVFATGRKIDTIYEASAMQTLGYMAGLQGKNAIINRDGYLEFRFYKVDAYTWQDLTDEEWSGLGDDTWLDLSGVKDISLVIDRDFQLQNGFKMLSDGEITIQGAISGSGDNPIVIGEGLSINFENPYITKGELQAVLGNISVISYMPSELKYFGCPALEIGDVVSVIDKNGREFNVLVSSNTWNFNGGCQCETFSAGVGDNEVNFSTSTSVSGRIDSVSQSVSNINTQLANLFGEKNGVFTVTTDKDGVTTGWRIVDDPFNPKLVVQATNQGIGISNDGGVTFNNAITGNGVSATTLASGSELIVGGELNKQGTITMLDYENRNSGGWDSYGIRINDVTEHTVGMPITQVSVYSEGDNYREEGSLYRGYAEFTQTNIENGNKKQTVVDTNGVKTTNDDLPDNSVGMALSEGEVNEPKMWVTDSEHITSVKPDGVRTTGNIVLNSTAQQDIAFSSDTHQSKMYGGNDSSSTAIGVWDEKNGNGVWTYNDRTKILYLLCDSGLSALNDIVIDSGTQDGWEYLKYANGLYICSKRMSLNIAMNSAQGSIYYGDSPAISFPVTFKAVPSINANGTGTSTTNAWYSVISATTSNCKVRGWRGTSASSSSYGITVTAIGRWN